MSPVPNAGATEAVTAATANDPHPAASVRARERAPLAGLGPALLIALVPVAPRGELAAAAADPGSGEVPPVSFKGEIAPILLRHCEGCHGTRKAKGKYRVDSYEHLLLAGSGGKAGVVPGDPAGSELAYRLTTEDEDERMPADADPLPPAAVERVGRWIAEGAVFDGGDDPALPLASLVPPAEHPLPPAAYRRPVPVAALAFGPGGAELFAGGYRELTVWDVTAGALRRRITNLPERIHAIDFDPGGTVLAVAAGAPGRLGEVRCFDRATGELLAVPLRLTDAVRDVRFSPDGTRLAAGASDGSVRVFETANWAQVASFAPHADWVYAVAWDPAGKRIASAGRDRTAKVFDLVEGRRLTTFSGHGGAVRGVAFHPDGERVYSCGADKKFLLWPVEEGRKAEEVASAGGEYHRLAAVTGAVVALSADGVAALFDRAQATHRRAFKGHSDWVISAACDLENRRLATATFDGQISVWDLGDGSRLTTFAAAPDGSVPVPGAPPPPE